MTRRALLSSASASLAAAATEPLRKGRALEPGDTVGLITPSMYVSDPDNIVLAERTLRYFDLKPKFGPNVRQREGYLGGSVKERISDLHAMFADPEVKAVFAIRGGYGAAQLLDSIDYPMIAGNPKLFLGYSDITALHLALNRHARLVTLHGPNVLSSLPKYTVEHLRRALFETKPLGVLGNPPDSDPLRPSHRVRTIRPGKARGPLAGGNLTIISTTLGTPYEIDTEGRVLFLEDVDEQPYSIDRMLTQLRLAGKLDAAAGIVFGECTNCRPRDYKPAFDSTFSLGEILDRILGNLKIPVFSGLTVGHTDDQLTLPIGLMTTLDADRCQLEIEESAVQQTV